MSHWTGLFSLVSVSSLLLSLGVLQVAAVTGIPFQKHVGGGGVGSSASSGSTGISLSDVQDAEYLVNVTIGGKDFTLQLDTGSSDLWVYAPGESLTIKNDSGLFQNVTYGKGSISGPVQFAEVKIGEFTIPSQAFIHANKTIDQGDTIGILGISFDDASESNIEAIIQQAWGADSTLGRTPLSNIFFQNTSLDTSYDLAIGRKDDLEEYSYGTFIIGGHAPGAENITQAPILPVEVLSQWTVTLEGFSVNGQNRSFGTPSSNSTRPGTLIALIDSGTSNAIMPSDLVEFIYDNVPGSVQGPDGTWYTPCYESANVSFVFGGQEFPVNPLDLARVYNFTETVSGVDVPVTVCVGAFQGLPPSLQEGLGGQIDMILGDTFMKNIYASFVYNMAVPGKAGGPSAIQMLSTTSTEDAWLDFLLSRTLALQQFPAVVDPLWLQIIDPDSFGAPAGINATSGGDDTGSSGSGASVAGAVADNAAPSSTASSAPSSSPSTASASGSASAGAVASLLDKYGPVVIGLLAGNIAVVLLLCAIALVAYLRRGGPKSRTLPTSYAPVSFKDKVDDDAELNAPVHNYGG